jgi:amidase
MIIQGLRREELSLLDEPDVESIRDLATTLGITLSSDEIRTYQRVLIEQLRELDEFAQIALPDDRPPLLYPARAPGYRPLATEDPYRAWLWKCEIGGEEDGLLAGRTVSFKDHISVAGIPQSFGCLQLADLVPDVDATIVTRVLAAGGRILGKNAMRGFTADFPVPLNPHNPVASVAGSSSGSAVAVAAGEVDISFGGDQGGSIRVPAAFCGTLGHKPTFGLVSHFGVGFGFEPTLDHVGPMGVSVEAVAAALEAVAGIDDLDPRQTRAVPARLDALTGLQRGVRGLRIGILQEGFAPPADTRVLDGVRAAIDVLARAGAQVQSVSVPQHTQLGVLYTALTIEGCKAVADTSFFGMGNNTYYPRRVIVAMDQMWRQFADSYPPETKLDRIAGAMLKRRYNAAIYAKAQNARPSVVRAYDDVLVDVDVLVMPTVRCLPPPLDESVAPDHLSAVEVSLRRRWGVRELSANCIPFNITGHPALAVPCGKVAGLPISMQLVGRHFADPLLMRVAYAYQESVDWAKVVGVSPAPTSGEMAVVSNV